MPLDRLVEDAVIGLSFKIVSPITGKGFKAFMTDLLQIWH
jgi:hypothetical protein